MVTMEDVVYEARERGYRVSSKIDAANNAEYSILQKNGNKFPLRYVDKSRTGGVRTHVGSLMRVFPGTADELLDWYEGEVAAGNYGVKIDEYIESHSDEE